MFICDTKLAKSSALLFLCLYVMDELFRQRIVW